MVTTNRSKSNIKNLFLFIHLHIFLLQIRTLLIPVIGFKSYNKAFFMVLKQLYFYLPVNIENLKSIYVQKPDYSFPWRILMRIQGQ